MADRDRIAGSLRALVERWLADLGFLFGALYPARVATDHGDGTVDLEVDDDDLDDHQHVPVRLGAPGQSVTVPAGARLRLGFDARDGGRPFAALWDRGTEPLTWEQRAEDAITLDADAIDLGAAAGVVARDGDAIEIWVPNPAPPPDELVVMTGFLRVISVTKSRVRA